MQRCVSRRWRGLRVLITVALGVALVLAASGCNQAADTPPASSSPPPAPGRQAAAAPGRLAYLKGADVYIEEEGKPPIRVTQDGQNIGPVWSPDGQWLLYVKRDVTNARLWVVRPDGTDSQPVDLERAVPYTWTAVSWSPSGKSLAYITMDVVGRVRELRVADFTAAGPGQPRQIYYTDEGVRALAWSPDEQQIALTAGSNRAQSHEPARLVIVPAAGGDPFEILQWPRQTMDAEAIPNHLAVELMALTWSPGGSWLTFMGMPQTPPETGVGLYMMPPELVAGGAADGDVNPFGRAQGVATVLPYPSWVVWAPGGEQVAVVEGRTRDGGINKAITLLTPGTPAQRQVVTPEGEVDRDPAWSPDGKRLAVSRTRNTGKEDPSVTAGEIWIMDPASGQQTQITDGTAGADWYPRWSADGRSLVWVRFKDDVATLMSAPADGSAPARALVTNVDAPPGRFGVIWSDAVFSYHPGSAD